jgi:hypothetical protein
MFLDLAQGVDDDTWVYHLERGDYSRWFRTAIKDDLLASDVQGVEQAKLPANESRKAVRAAVEKHYTGAA